MTSFAKQVKISDRKKASVTSWKGKVWIHIRDDIKGKSVSFSKDEFVSFLSRLDKLQHYIKECERYIKKGQKTKPKKTKDLSDSELSTASSDSE